MIGDFVPWNPRNPNGPGWTEREDGCHIWRGATTPNGYACGNDARTHRTDKVYRIRYEREIGPIPEGMDLDHYICSNGASGCCNPHHCRPVTRRENVLRSESPAAECASHMRCPSGHILEGENLVACDRHVRGFRRCRICTNERNARQHAKNREQRLAKRREHYAANKDALNALARVRVRSPEQLARSLAYQRAYYAAHPEKFRLKRERRKPH